MLHQREASGKNAIQFFASLSFAFAVFRAGNALSLSLPARLRESPVIIRRELSSCAFGKDREGKTTGHRASDQQLLRHKRGTRMGKRLAAGRRAFHSIFWLAISSASHEKTIFREAPQSSLAERISFFDNAFRTDTARLLRRRFARVATETRTWQMK